MKPAFVGPAAPRAWLSAALAARWRGLMLCAVIAMAASLIARLHGGPQLLYALLFGVSFHFLHEDERIRPGVELCTSLVLRLGVALLGARITLEQIAALGWASALAVVACVLSTVLLGIGLARRLGLDTAQGLLSGCATAICGASAALALSAVLPRSREQDRFTLLVVVTVTAFSTLAMLIYPLLAHALHLTPGQAGLFIGGSIHDVAQVVAAGYLLGTVAGDTATVVKLFRVSLLALVVLAAAAAYRSRTADSGTGARLRLTALVPWFLWLFLALVLLQSAHAIPPAMLPMLAEVSRDCLVLAIAALGVKTSFQALLRTGWRPFVLLLTETVWLGAAWLLVLLAGWTH
ncbi:putative sulfate exporter family transporter [Ideonella sp. DXS22W]|uniref:Sulfate exporter family transporter n=1 Tax=Pseudaquabacterium inlustre TaxID=2984192 RepID=A0ABU9CKI5_9BURK